MRVGIGEKCSIPQAYSYPSAFERSQTFEDGERDFFRTLGLHERNL